MRGLLAASEISFPLQLQFLGPYSRKMKLPRNLYLLSLLILSNIGQAAPEWIWVKDGRKAKVRAEFKRSVPIVDHLRSARLQAVADGASLTIRINGRVVDQVPAHGSLLEREVTSLLKKGENLFSLTAVSVNDAPAVALQLDWTDAKGKNGALFTNSKWKTNGATARVKRPRFAECLAEEPCGHSFLNPIPRWCTPQLRISSQRRAMERRAASLTHCSVEPGTEGRNSQVKKNLKTRQIVDLCSIVEYLCLAFISKGYQRTLDLKKVSLRLQVL